MHTRIRGVNHTLTLFIYFKFSIFYLTTMTFLDYIYIPVVSNIYSSRLKLSFKCIQSVT